MPVTVVKLSICEHECQFATFTALNRMTSSNVGGAGAAAEGGQDLSDLSSSRAEAKLEEAGTEFVETMLKFDGLVEVMRASQISEVIENALQGNTESGMQLDDEVCDAAIAENKSLHLVEMKISNFTLSGILQYE